uniref:Early meiotic induction protein 1 n=1 Tax=Candidozyma auris TaxID=498019 RepID=A0A0L0P632_CANAR
MSDKIINDKDLEDIQGLFQDPDPEINARRVEVYKTARENDISSFPSDLSIMSAFDDVLLCFSLGGQIKNIYRYGTYTTCQAQREKFWFAMWNGSFSEKDIDIEKVAANQRELERRQKVQEFYKQRLLEKKALGLSEDVWDERKTLLNRPFMENVLPQSFQE